MTSRTCVSSVVESAKGNWLSVFGQCGIVVADLNVKSSCPICGGKDRFKFDNKYNKGDCYCNQCGTMDGLTLVSKALELSIKDAAKTVARALGLEFGTAITDKQRMDMKARQRQIASDEEALTRDKHATASEFALRVFNESTPLVSHSYATIKKLDASTLKVTSSRYRMISKTGKEYYMPAGTLIIPVVDLFTNKLNSIQFIKDGEKFKQFITDSNTHGFYRINGTTDHVIVGEGYATVDALCQSTGCKGYVSFNCHNLRGTAERARRDHPTAVIVIAGDYDIDESGNERISTKTATEAALIDSDTFTFIPSFMGVQCDWSDVWLGSGLDDGNGTMLKGSALIRELFTDIQDM